MYFSVRGCAAEQGIIFKILTLRQSIIFVKICSMTGSIYVIFYSERLLKPFTLCECDSDCLDGNLFSVFDRLLQISFAEHNVILRNSRTEYCLRKLCSGTVYHFQEFDTGIGWLFRFSSGTSPYVCRPSIPQAARGIRLF